jgi:hexosaminidase
MSGTYQGAGLEIDDKHSKEERLQSFVINHIEKFLNDHGRQIIVGMKFLEGGLAPNATVMSWRGEKGGIEAAKQKHDVIMTRTTTCISTTTRQKIRRTNLSVLVVTCLLKECTATSRCRLPSLRKNKIYQRRAG